MRAVFLGLFVCLSAAAGIAQQPGIPRAPQPVPTAAPLRDREVKVVVEGCIQGGRRVRLLRSGDGKDVHAEITGAREFVLEGPREVLAQLGRDHDGHQEQVAGVAVLPPSDETVDTRTRDIGGTRITGGVRQGAGGTVRAPAPPRDARGPVRLKVATVRHVDETCVTRS
jgi:hypothetical protein